jgi:prepilin-type N-terminal cleavage/methylation domain-containing protein
VHRKTIAAVSDKPAEILRDDFITPTTERRRNMLNKFRKNQKGFTLIELLIVVAIIGILAAIAIPQFASYRAKAFNSAAQSDLKTMKTSLEAFYTDNYYYTY